MHVNKTVDGPISSDNDIVKIYIFCVIYYLFFIYASKYANKKHKRRAMRKPEYKFLILIIKLLIEKIDKNVLIISAGFWPWLLLCMKKGSNNIRPVVVCR